MIEIAAIATRGKALVRLAGEDVRRVRETGCRSEEKAVRLVLGERQGGVPIRVAGEDLNLPGIEQLEAGDIGVERPRG